MKIIKNIFLFFKRVFNKKSNNKMIEEGIIEMPNEEKTKFINSLKINLLENKKRVETLTCVGDGLGIQTKINY